jgi:hypothetical protein
MWNRKYWLERKACYSFLRPLVLFYLYRKLCEKSYKARRLVFLFWLFPQLLIIKFSNLNMLETYYYLPTPREPILRIFLYVCTPLLNLSLTKFAAHKQKEANKQVICLQRQTKWLDSPFIKNKET